MRIPSVKRRWKRRIFPCWTFEVRAGDYGVVSVRRRDGQDASLPTKPKINSGADHHQHRGARLADPHTHTHTFGVVVSAFSLLPNDCACKTLIINSRWARYVIFQFIISFLIYAWYLSDYHAIWPWRNEAFLVNKYPLKNYIILLLMLS